MNSDLLVAGGDFLVGFGNSASNSETRSELVDRRGQRLGSGQTLRIWGLFAQDAGVPLRWPLRKAAGPAVRILDDPLQLFLDQLVAVPVSGDVKGSLRADDQSFLLPFRSDILDWFPLASPVALRVLDAGVPPARVGASVMFHSLVGHWEVELWIPVQKNLFVRTTKRYQRSDYLQAFLPRFAVWPDFESTEWKSYFYYRGGTILSGREDELTLNPRFPEPPMERSRQHGAHWWRSSRPAEAFMASDSLLSREMGLVLGPFGRLAQPPPLESWRLSIDLGSTHTRLFCVPVGGGTPQPLVIKPRAAVLTGSVQGGLSDQEFFRAEGHLPLEELPTQIVIPIHPDGARPSEISPTNWLPADGVAVLGRVHRDFLFDDQVRLFTEVKWHLDLQSSDPAAVFLSHVLLLAEAEAFDRGAKIAEVGYSHPSAFPPLLVDNFEHRWRRLLPEKNGGARNGGSEVEAFSVLKYLADTGNASPTALLMAIDIGGSTSDIAIWRANRCHALESIRFAASAISAFLCLDKLWDPYCARLVEFGLGEKASSIQAALLKAKRHERLPLLYATLNFLEDEGRLDEIQIRFHQEPMLRSFLTHCSYIYGALVYYLGLLAREVAREEKNDQQENVIYLCGKGAKFFSWLQREGLRSGLEDIFRAGLQGPEGSVKPVEVRFVPSTLPKWEVGYGRLVTHADDRSRHWFEPWGEGRDFLEPRPVRAGEAGYGELSPLDSLDLTQLKMLVNSGPSAVPKQFSELGHFLKSWERAVYSLRPALLPPGFHGSLVERLMGRVQGSIGYELADAQRAVRLSLEPLFFTQCKVFYELAAGVPQSLWLGRLPEVERR
jgi:hypothetical protein